MPVILALGKLRQENHEFEASLGYTVRVCLKKILRLKRERDTSTPKD
jgi:hypothetical protein